ncbi:MAG: monovalent cation/H(+) antiporter subunit G [Gemmatimonadota bacterium]
MIFADVVTGVLLLFGAFFFLAGTVGIVRFPDTLSRLHAVTKADNLGLGIIVFALVFQANSIVAALKLLLIWSVVLLGSATTCILVAGASRRRDEEGERAR